MIKTYTMLALFRISIMVVFILTAISCSTEPVETSSQSIDKTKVLAIEYDYSEDETELVTIINKYRDQRGLKKLEMIDYISYTAEEHNYYMIENDSVSHNGFDKRADNLEKALDAEKIGENIAYSYVIPELAFKAWLASPGHKANIEGDFTHFGISIRINPKNGKKYYTNIFTKIISTY